MSSGRGSPVDNRSISTVRRNYQMAYTPSGFWSRLITRLMVSVQRWRAIEQIKEESYSLVYWREGIGVVYEGGHFQVESYHELVRCLMLRYSYCVTLIGKHVESRKVLAKFKGEVHSKMAHFFFAPTKR